MTMHNYTFAHVTLVFFSCTGFSFKDEAPGSNCFGFGRGVDRKLSIIRSAYSVFLMKSDPYRRPIVDSTMLTTFCEIWSVRARDHYAGRVPR